MVPPIDRFRGLENGVSGVFSELGRHYVLVLGLPTADYDRLSGGVGDDDRVDDLVGPRSLKDERRS